MESLLTGLNPAQRAAVTSPASVLQVLAPPGSGKTKTLTARVAHLLQHDGFAPWNIIVCTFTVKAAREMKERIGNMIGDGLESKLILGTFHSVARRYLVRYGYLIGIKKGFGIADSTDSLSIIKRIIKRRKLNIDPGAARSRISHQKAQCITHEECGAKNIKTVDQQEFSVVYTEYELSLAKSNQLDYDDLLLRCVDLLRSHPECVSNVEAVLIDEFQDTNLVQFDLMRLFAQSNKRVTIVGGKPFVCRQCQRRELISPPVFRSFRDQSIYGFRSAEIKNLQRMRTQYPDTLVVLLEQNYRSSGSILLVAMEVIQQDQSRPAKTLLPTHCVGTRPVFRQLQSASIEAEWIVSEIQRSTALTGNLLTYTDVAILVRSASLSRHIEAAFGRSGIPYRMVGGHRFFDRFEVKVLLDYLRIINQPDNTDALARIINIPPRKVGDTTVKRLLEEAEAKNVTLWSLVSKCARGHSMGSMKITKATEQGLEAFLDIISTSRRLTQPAAKNVSLVDLLVSLMKKLSFKEYLEKSHPEDHEVRWSNVQELLAQAAEFTGDKVSEDGDEDDEALPHLEGITQSEVSTTEDPLSRFLANVALSSNVRSEDEESSPEGQVTISTIHAAKGLEWPVVFIPAAYEGSIPHSRAEDTDEERRLLYVAMTRAKVLLYLSCPLKSSQNEPTTMSSFLTHNPVESLLDTSGPAFTHSVVQSIAHILGRLTPTASEIFAGSQGVHQKDNLWPINGQEANDEMTERDQNQTTEQEKNKYSGFRRPHVKAVKGHGLNTSISSKMLTSNTTMQNLASFSVASGNYSSTFVTAGSHLTELKAQESTSVASIQRNGTRSQKNNKILSNERCNSGTSARLPTVRSARDARGQGSLFYFFKKGNDPKANAFQAGATSKVRPPCGEDFSLSKKIKMDSPGLELSLSDPRLPELAHSVQCKQQISPSSGQHRLRGAPMRTRPHISKLDDDVAKAYVFLSSSPPRDDLIEEAESEPMTSFVTPPDPTKADERNTVIRNSDFRPATTLHTTSIASLNNALVSKKKTLGLRRSMNGWANRAQPAFTVPSSMQKLRENSS
ncbi:MAG: hypothetical protein M1812_006067 [Candelaria pacifica]|nr:MAG: hypothetical protein M1812_006067 [Candelaria pacifica]